MLLILLVVLAWCVLPIPLAMAIGIALRAGSTPPQRRSTYTLVS